MLVLVANVILIFAKSVALTPQQIDLSHEILGLLFQKTFDLLGVYESWC